MGDVTKYLLLLVASLCVHGNTELLRGYIPQSIHKYDDYLLQRPVLIDIYESPDLGGTTLPLVNQGLIPLSAHEYFEELLDYTLAPSGRPLLGDIREPSDLVLLWRRLRM
jgi:hypothetical protein